MTTSPAPLRILVLCTGNSARSQMAEALFNALGRGRVVADSAGSQPAPRVNPLALETLEHFAVPFLPHAPRGLDDIAGRDWDLIITVCDNAREACPLFPGQPASAHWGMPDPAAVEGSEETRRAAFRDAFVMLKRRIELLLTLPLESLRHGALQEKVQAIGAARPEARP